MAEIDFDDIGALTVLLTRQVRAQDDKAVAEVEKKAAEERLSEATKRMANCRAAFSAFGFDTTDAGLWDAVKRAMGDYAWNLAFQKARPQPPSIEQHSLSHQTGDGTARAIGDEDSTDDADTEQEDESLSEDEDDTDEGRKSIKMLVLKYLSEAGARGLKAAELRSMVEESQKTNLHGKTIGMTLYRLSRADLVRRDNRTWYSVPPAVETEGADTSPPGSKEGGE